MKAENNSPHSRPARRAPDRAHPTPDRPPRRGQTPLQPRILAALGRRQCHYCIADTPAGQMDRALFCAAPTRLGVYCPAHARRTHRSAPLDPDAFADEIIASLDRARTDLPPLRSLGKQHP